LRKPCTYRKPWISFRCVLNLDADTQTDAQLQQNFPRNTIRFKKFVLKYRRI